MIFEFCLVIGLEFLTEDALAASDIIEDLAVLKNGEDGLGVSTSAGASTISCPLSIKRY